MQKQVQSENRDVVFDKGSHWRAKIGYVLLAMEQVIPDDVYRLTPEGVGIHFSRVRMANAVTNENLMAAAKVLPEAASLILPETDIDVLTYACTSGSFVPGEKYVVEQLNKGRPGVKATTLVTGVIRALRALNAKKIVMGTPYLDEVNTVEAEYFTKQGFDILNIQGLNITNDTDIARVSPQFIKEFAKSLDTEEADAIFISCGAMRTLDIIEALEQETGKPVVTSNQALVWDALRLAGVMDKIPHYGKLFLEH